jgi:hypothetical protein
VTDGRYIDPALGVLSGEGSQQRVRRKEERLEQIAGEAWTNVPSRDGYRPDDPTYYDKPVLKAPVWKWVIPAYFYVGGCAGASSLLGALAQTLGRGSMRGLVKRSRRIAAGGTMLGTAFLVYDLGVPRRFFNMLRVFRPTSPLNLGSWLLSSASTLSAGAAMLVEQPGALGAAGDVAGLGAGILGPPLSGYTAVVVSNSAVPLWQEIRRTLPALFISSSISGAAALLDLMDLADEEEKVVHWYGVVGKVGELAAAAAVQKDASRVDRVGRPLREGATGAMWRGASACTAASLALAILPSRSRWKRVASALLGTAGSAGVKFAIHYAGVSSARDPRATFHQQRAIRGDR